MLSFFHPASVPGSSKHPLTFAKTVLLMLELGKAAWGKGRVVQHHKIVPLDSILEWGVQSCVAYLHDLTRNIPVKQTKNKHIRKFKGSWFAENLKEEFSKCQLVSKVPHYHDQVLCIIRVSDWLNPLSSNSDQQQFSPDNVHTLSRDKAVRI